MSWRASCTDQRVSAGFSARIQLDLRLLGSRTVWNDAASHRRWAGGRAQGWSSRRVTLRYLPLAHMVPSASNRGYGCNNRHLFPYRPFATPLVELPARRFNGSSPIVCQTGGSTDADIIACLYLLSAQVSIAWVASTRRQALDAKPLALHVGRKQLLVSLGRRP